MSLSWFSMSCSTLPVTMFALGWAELSGVQPIRPPPPSPTDSGLPPDSPSTQEATPAAAAFEYPLSTRYWPSASRLLPLAISDCTAELPAVEVCVLVLPEEDCVLVLPCEGWALVLPWEVVGEVLVVASADRSVEDELVEDELVE